LLKLFICLLFFLTTNGFSADYFPLHLGNFWIYDFPQPKPPETTCSWGDSTMQRIDSMYVKDNSIVYAVNSYAISKTDTCLIENRMFYYVDSANFIYKMYDISNSDERYFFGLHDFTSISDEFDTLNIHLHSNYTRNGKNYENCYELQFSNEESIIYAPDVGIIAIYNEGYWFSIVAYSINLSKVITPYRYSNHIITNVNRNEFTSSNQFMDILGRSISTIKFKSGLFIVKKDLTVFINRNLKYNN
jgi:hypothetical protein